MGFLVSKPAECPTHPQQGLAEVLYVPQMLVCAGSTATVEEY